MSKKILIFITFVLVTSMSIFAQTNTNSTIKTSKDLQFSLANDAKLDQLIYLDISSINFKDPSQLESFVNSISDNSLVFKVVDSKTISVKLNTQVSKEANTTAYWNQYIRNNSSKFTEMLSYFIAK